VNCPYGANWNESYYLIILKQKNGVFAIKKYCRAFNDVKISKTRIPP
jgi:hypothetical protein